MTADVPTYISRQTMCYFVRLFADELTVTQSHSETTAWPSTSTQYDCTYRWSTLVYYNTLPRCFLLLSSPLPAPLPDDPATCLACCSISLWSVSDDDDPDPSTAMKCDPVWFNVSKIFSLDFAPSNSAGIYGAKAPLRSAEKHGQRDAAGQWIVNKVDIVCFSPSH